VVHASQRELCIANIRVARLDSLDCRDPILLDLSVFAVSSFGDSRALGCAKVRPLCRFSAGSFLLEFSGEYISCLNGE
jgi:hypothetical protein